MPSEFARITRLLASLLAIAGVVCFLAANARGTPAPHPLLTASATATIGRDGSLEVVVRCDVLAFALGEPPRTVDDQRMFALLNGPRPDLERVLADGRTRFASGFHAFVDGQAVPARELATPTAEQVVAWRAANPKAPLPVKLEIVARVDLARGSSRLVLEFPPELGEVVLTVQAPAAEPLAALVRPGERSDEYAYDLNAPVIAGTAPLGEKPSPPGMAPTPTPASSDAANQAPGTPTPRIGSLHSAAEFVRIGFAHIVPEGLDHILFVLGLFFLSPRVKPLLVQITCFTLAHSVTLALSASGVFTLPGSVVEPAIAASIAFVAVENLCTQKVHAWRPLVVFAFGLVHGLGFASAFAESMGTARVPLGPVLLFNVGVEFGQLAVVGIALLTVGWFRHRTWYRARVSIPASILIAGMGLFWFVQRLMEAR